MIIALVVGASLAACTTAPSTPAISSSAGVGASAIALPIDLDQIDHLAIGVLIAPVDGEGSEYRPMIAGATVAASRFALSGGSIELVNAYDDGTSAGALAATQQLLDAGVSALIIGSSGEHLAAAIDAASLAETAVILPYAQAPSPRAGVWSTAPTVRQTGETLTGALSHIGANRPLLLASADSSLTAWLDPVDRIDPDNPQAVATTIERLTSLQADAVVIDAPADIMAELVASLHHDLGDLSVPILVGPAAVTPLFGEMTTVAGASALPLISVGVNTDDQAELASGGAGLAADSFFEALKLDVDHADCLGLPTQSSCSGTDWADINSHDAVVALVRAAERARSSKPSDLRSSLEQLSLDWRDGLAGADLDFHAANTLDDDAIDVLHSTTEDPGERPDDGSNDDGLFWFAELG
ncbi:MAG: hypothetical protein LBV30_09690, partial [Propionibacteriaceae bacterium]|jgi:ABC-type branched-subunit amino acid transport system substrate-binding protein|nr:hypothetical protein [Propionibacteriaceae bacterium]